MFKFLVIFLCFMSGVLNVSGQFPEQKLIPRDNVSGDFFGLYLGMHYPDLIVSAHQKDIFGYASGVIYVYRAQTSDGRYNEFQMIFPEDGDVEEFFGYSIEMDDQWVVLGSHHDSDAGGSSGSAFILKKENSLWSVYQKLLPDDPKSGDEFGKAVALNGQEVFIGAWLDDDKGSNSGAVYIFRLENDTWMQVDQIYSDPAAPYDQFGNFISSHGDFLLVGAPENQANGSRSGCAYLFSKINGEWKQTDRWIPADGHPGAQFGQAVSISDEWAAVGSYKSDSYCPDCGAVYIYKRQGNTWAYYTTLISPDVLPGDHFGNAVHISDRKLAIGAYFDDDLGSNSGSVYIFHMEADQWDLLTKINASDGSFGDAFGSSVLLEGSKLAVGAYGHSQNGFFSGAAYIYDISEIVSAKQSEITGSAFTVYPGIIRDKICIINQSDRQARATFNLYTASGQLIRRFDLQAGQHCFYLNRETIPQGHYFYTIATGDIIQSGTLFKL